MINNKNPNVLLLCNLTEIIDGASWPYPSGDIWYTNGVPYQWTVKMIVNPLTHSSEFTPTPFQYSGLDVEVGMWIAAGAPTKAVKIVDIVVQQEFYLELIVEDVERFNTFSDITGSGFGIFGIGGGDAYIFELAEDGLPLLFPLSTGAFIDPFFTNDLISRFRINNPRFRFRFNQVAHGFEVGDEIYLDSDDGLFKLLVPGEQPIGRVVDVSDSPDTFLVSPVNRIDESITLPGVPGQIIYYDDSTPGGLTLTPNNRAAYLKLSDTSAMILEEGINPPPVSVYADLGDRPTTSKVGHIAYVSDVGNGEWAMYVYTASGWVETSNEDSARTDAFTAQATLTNTDTAPVLVTKISSGRRVTLITVEVNEIFGSDAELSIVESINNQLILTNDLVDLTNIGTYTTQSDIVLGPGDTDILATLIPGATAQGSLTITLTYV